MRARRQPKTPHTKLTSQTPGYTACNFRRLKRTRQRARGSLGQTVARRLRPASQPRSSQLGQNMVTSASSNFDGPIVVVFASCLREQAQTEVQIGDSAEWRTLVCCFARQDSLPWTVSCGQSLLGILVCNWSSWKARRKQRPLFDLGVESSLNWRFSRGLRLQISVKSCKILQNSLKFCPSFRPYK